MKFSQMILKILVMVLAVCILFCFVFSFLIHLIGSILPAHFPDPEWVVWPLSHPLLRKVKLRPRSEYDWGPGKDVFCGGAATGWSRAPNRWDPSGCAQPALYCQEPTCATLLRRSPQTRPGSASFALFLTILCHLFFVFFCMMNNTPWQQCQWESIMLQNSWANFQNKFIKCGKLIW